MSGVAIGKKKKKSKDNDNDNNDDDDDNDNESTSESAYYYNDYPKLYFAIRKGRYTNNTICINWDDAQREVKDYHYAEYIATPTLIQATKYVNKLGEFEMTRTKSKSKSKARATATTTTTKSSRSGHRPLKKRTCHQISSSSQQQAAEAEAEREGLYDLNNCTATSTTISSSPCTHDNSRTVSNGKKGNNTKKKKEKKKKQSLETKTKTKTKETTTTTTTDEKATKKQPNKSKSSSNKTRKLLLEYYQLINPNISKDHQLKIDEFLLSRGMLKRKKVMFTKHWNHSGLVIMCNENCNPFTAIEKYDDWIEQRRYEKYNDSDNDNDNDNTVDDSRTRISTSRKRQRKSSSRPVIMLTTADDDIPVNTDDDDDNILVDTEDDDGDDDENVSQDNINNKKKPNPTTTTTNKKRRSTATTAATSTSLSSSSSLSSSLEVCPAALEEVVVVTAAERVKNKRRLSYDAANNGDNNSNNNNNNNNDDKDNNKNHQLQQENTEDDDEAWNEMYTELQKFYQEHNHCKVTSKLDRTIIGKQDGIKKSLQYWVSYQQRRMRPNVINRSGARSLSLREELLLNELKFIPNFIEVQNEFKQYLAHGIKTRIAKAFEVFDDDGTIKKSIYFGTIDHISSFTNRWVRITFDDGDLEDFDKACVVKGLELYEKYKDLDPNPEGVVAPVAAVAVAAGVHEGGDINIDDDDDDDDRFIAAVNVNNKRNDNNTDDHASDEKDSTTTTATTTATTTVDNGSNGDDDDGELEF